MRFLLLNYPTFTESMRHSLALRNQDLVNALPQIQFELIVAGCVSFGLCVLVAMPIFYSAVRNVSERTQAVTKLLLHVPRQLAKALRDRSQAGLERMMAASDDAAMEVSASSQGGGQSGFRSDAVGLQDEEREKMLFVQ